MESSSRQRPKGYRAIAILGITANTILLLHSLQLVDPTILRASSASALMRTAADKAYLSIALLEIASLLGNIITSLAVLTGFIGLLLQKSWSRRTCVLGLLAQIAEMLFLPMACRIIEIIAIFGTTLSLRTILLPYVAFAAANIVILLYLRSGSVKNHLSPKRELIQLEIGL